MEVGLPPYPREVHDRHERVVHHDLLAGQHHLFSHVPGSGRVQGDRSFECAGVLYSLYL